jgi:beta-lactamase regulating signal transducer with metallopeptidase domain/uncharacterized membrane protein YkoI
MERNSQLLLNCLLNACWQIALITAVAAFCAWLLREIAARYRHLLWVAALALCFSLPVLTGLRLSNGANFKIQPEPLMPVQNAALSSTQIPLDIQVPISPKETISFIPVSRNLATGLIALYFLFLCYRAANLVKAWTLTRGIARSVSALELPEHAQTIIERCRTALGVKRVRVFSSPAVPLPITIGGLRPIVILPEQLLLEGDRDVLTSAIAHELVHVSRRDYALNLIYELIYLPLSFHPAAALARRRIRETRELSCDELVADRLVEADAYARSLVKLAGSAMTPSRQTTITVGITDADILEERVMTILKRQKFNLLRKNLLLIAATLLLAVPCIAAMPLALRVNINSPDTGVAPGQDATQQARQRKERARGGFEVVMPTLSEETEAGTLSAWLKRPGEAVQQGEVVARVATSKGPIDVAASISGVIERILVAAGERAAAGSIIAVIRDQGWVLSGDVATAQAQEAERQALIKVLEAQVEMERQGQAAATTAQGAEQRVRQAELERALVAQMAAGRQDAAATAQNAEQRARQAEVERDLVVRMAQAGKQDAAQTEVRLRVSQQLEQTLERLRAEQESYDQESVSSRLAEHGRMAQQQAELAKQATITMQQAIQIATNQYPGAVLESRLVRERNQPCYILTILSDNGTETTTTRVLISGIDGSVLKATKQ